MCKKGNSWGLERNSTSGPLHFPLFLPRNDLLQPFLSGIFPKCEDINMEKLLNFVFMLRPVFFLLKTNQAYTDGRVTLSAEAQAGTHLLASSSDHNTLLFGSFKDDSGNFRVYCLSRYCTIK